MNRRDAFTALIARMFEAGLDTKSIAERLDVPESRVANALAKVRDDNDFYKTTISTVFESLMEGGEG
jgi:DNA-binding transcriptional regulator LsrR (DeoR family)